MTHAREEFTFSLIRRFRNLARFIKLFGFGEVANNKMNNPAAFPGNQRERNFHDGSGIEGYIKRSFQRRERNRVGGDRLLKFQGVFSRQVGIEIINFGGDGRQQPNKGRVALENLAI